MRIHARFLPLGSTLLDHMLFGFSRATAGRFARVALLLGVLSSAAVAAELADLFRPFQTEHVALSPDGRHLAYSEHKDGLLRVIVINVETNKGREIDVAHDIVEPLSGRKEKTPAQLSYLRWATADRLILTIDNLIVWGIDADGRNAKVLVRARDLTSTDDVPGSSWLPSARTRRSPLQSGSNNPAIFGGAGEAEQQAAKVQRSRNAGMIPTSIVEDESEDEATAFSPSIETDDVFESRPDRASPFPRRPYVLPLAAEDPNFIYVEARTATGLLDDGADASTNVYKVDIRSGKFAKIDNFVGASRVLVDQQGRPRLAVMHSMAEREFLHYPPKLSLTRKLDQQLGGPKAFAFNFSPENYLGTRSVPLAFDRDPNVLYFGSNVGRNTFGVYALNLATNQRTELAIEHPSADLVDFEQPFSSRSLVIDRHRGNLVGVRFFATRAGTSWLDPELAQLQVRLEKSLPEKTIEILEWSEKRDRLLLLAWGDSDPGTYYLFDVASNRLSERARRAPWLSEERLNPAVPFTFSTADGVRLSGYLTVPREPRRMPAPLLVYCHDGPWNRDLPGFNRGAQALATMGFAVAQVNYRGSSGFGLKHLQALQTGFDEVALRDVLSTIDYLQARYELHPKLIAILGNGYGGYLAVRALQLHPDRFRCAVSMNAPSDFPAWLNNPPGPNSFRRDLRRAFFGTEHARLAAASTLTHAEKITKPLLLVHGERNELVPPSHSRSLRDATRKSPEPAQLLELAAEGHSNWLPGTYTQVFAKLEEFFNAAIYNYDVKVGPAVEVPETK